ncbi:hypothetical protein AG1IA_06879 [Rhizoctonia solani AG-1 IA]|uniref:Uncharacterized protein n=1 Tax=Thanatephorus cucumeris (strain AG1-IA) TaxID=983506 RepID=L8WQP4_THACA|nr:hypothetical protein AG1IA_06879 [Rhizoctonia solani AG-1 IA]
MWCGDEAHTTELCRSQGLLLVHKAETLDKYPCVLVDNLSPQHIETPGAWRK